MARLLPPDEAARRARAAVEYAPYTRTEVQRRAEQLDARITRATFNRITSEKNPRGFNNSDELTAFAAACEVPAWFLEDGFLPDENHDRLAQVETVLGILVNSLSLEQLDADEARALRRWQRRNEPPSEGEEPGSQSLGEE